jgi:hypothetical protein
MTLQGTTHSAPVLAYLFPRLIDETERIQELEVPMLKSSLNLTSRVAIAARIAEQRRRQYWNNLTISSDYHLPSGRVEGQAKAARWLWQSII